MAINPIRLLRSIVSGVRPPSAKMDGEPYVNFADNQLGVMLGGTPVDMLGVTIFSANASYPARVTVVYQGTLYQSLVAVSPGAWNATQWTKYTTAA
jgi:hypothetical protein